MALKTGDNFDYQGQKPNFGRDSFKTLAEMKAYPETSIDDGHISYVAETKRHYKFVSSSSSDPTTGKWRTIEDQEITETSTNPVESKADFVCAVIFAYNPSSVYLCWLVAVCAVF